MIETISLILTCIFFLLVITVVLRAIISKQKIIGKPPIPVLFFIIAKVFVLVNLMFLVTHGFQIKVEQYFDPPVFVEIIALFALFAGVVLIFLSTLQLNKDLIFGLSDSTSHKLQTGGIYALSRHPFYLGFIFILFSSCLFTPNYANYFAFAGAWFLHHLIMIEEEKSLEANYGDEYRHYKNKVHRYINLKLWP
jgi:protein-S-isoprenylcysteine O-methyltransferase Ste14